jgi:hypothetical protein
MGDWPEFSPAPHRTAISAGDVEHSIGGALATNAFIPIITQAWTANVAIYVPFRITNWMTIAKATWENGATVAGNVSVGIYNAEQGQIVEARALMAGASAQQVITLTATLAPGLYYLGFSSDSSTATLGTYTAASVAGIFRAMGVFEQVTAYPLPAPAVFATMTRLFIPSVAIVTNSVG